MSNVLHMLLAFWGAVPFAGAAAIVSARRALRLTARREMCVACRYDLAGIWMEATCCPECGLGQRGHPVLAADSQTAVRTVDVASLALVWWAMLTLTVLGIGFVFVAGCIAAEAQTGP